MDFFRRFGVTLLVLGLACIPLFYHNEYIVHSVLGKVCIYVIIVAGLDLVVGYSGDVSAGHAGLFAVGAYASAIMMWKLHAPFPVCVIVATILGALFGVILGVPALRLKGPYLAVSTIAFGIIIQTFMNETVWLTKGSSGIREIPRLNYFGISFDGNYFLYIIFPFTVLALLMKHGIVTSYWGRSFEALKESPIAAACSGVSRFRFKLSAFVTSAALTGFAGAFFPHVDKYIGPPTFSFELSVSFLIMLIFGGTRSILGNVLGTLFIIILPDLFNFINDWRLAIYGGLLLFTLYFLPRGVVGLLHTIGDRFIPKPLPGSAAILAAENLKAGIEAVKLRPEALQTPIGDSLLELKELTIKFGGLTAVNKLDMVVKRGQIHALIGPNGSGKSTTVNLITGIYVPTSGEVLLRGNRITGAPDRISGLGIARTFQNVALFGDMTVVDNVMVGLHHSFKGGFLDIVLRTKRAKREESDARVRALALVDFVGIGHLAEERAKNLPYGKQRLLEIARALGSDPSLLLLDEPAAGLTSGEIGEMEAIIRKVRDAGVTVFLIEHHMDLVMAISDEITVLDFGQKIAQGTPAQIQADDRVINAYLGTSGTGHHIPAHDAAAGSPEPKP